MNTTEWATTHGPLGLPEDLIGRPLIPPTWQAIKPLVEPQLPTFPVEVFPQPLQDYVVAIAQQTQTPLDLAATQCLGVCSAAIARQVRIAARPGLVQPTNLFLTSLTTGTYREEDLLAHVRQPLVELEAEQFAAARVQIAEAESLRRQNHIELKRYEKDGPDGTWHRDRALALAGKIAENPIPAMPRMLIDDRTPQRIDKLLAEQKGRLACFFGEGAVLDQFTGTTSQRQLARHKFFRQAYRGEDLQVDLPRGDSVYVRQASLTCAYAINRDTINGLQQRRTRQGRGLLDCFLFSLPASNLGSRNSAATAVSAEVAQQYTALVRRLHELFEPVTLQLNEEAQQLFEAWEQEVEASLSPDDPRATFRAWLDRLPANTLRIAGILHAIAATTDTDVSAEAMQAAIAIGRYFWPHAEATFATMHCHAGEAIDGARYLLRWIQTHRIRSFSRREAHQRSRARFALVDQINAALEELVRRGYLVLAPEPPADQRLPGRPTTLRFLVHPDALPQPSHSKPRFEYEPGASQPPPNEPETSFEEPPSPASPVVPSTISAEQPPAEMSSFDLPNRFEYETDSQEVPLPTSPAEISGEAKSPEATNPSRPQYIGRRGPRKLRGKQRRKKHA